MAQQKTAPRERVVLGVLMIGTSLLGLALVVGSRVVVLGTHLGPLVWFARALLLAGALAIAAAAALAASHVGTSGGLRLLGRELPAGLFAGGVTGAGLGMILRTVFPGSALWVAVLALFLGAAAFVLWFAQRASAEGDVGSSGVLAAFRAYVIPSPRGNGAKLEEIRERVTLLPTLHPTGAMVMGPGARAGQQLLDIVSDNCRDAIEALETGRDPQGDAITPTQVGRGLRILSRDARQDIGIVLTSLDHDGFMEFQRVLDELDEIAASLEAGGGRSGRDRAGLVAVALLTAVPVVIAAGGIYVAAVPATSPAGGRQEGASADRRTTPQPPELSGVLAYDGEVSSGQYRIFALDLETSVETQLTDGADNDFTPAWSPDGTRIAFTRWPAEAIGGDSGQLAGDLYVMAADGSGAVGVAASDSVEWGTTWSPDGGRLLIATGQPDDYYTFEIAVMGSDGAGLVPLTSNDVPDFHPQWSPDGSSIAFVSGTTDRTHVMVMNADGSNVRELTPSPGTYSDPAWSPDGESVAFLMGPGGGASTLMVVDVDSPDMRELAGGAMPPVWSPDGGWVLFARGTELLGVPADGGAEVVLGTFPHPPGSLSWHVP